MYSHGNVELLRAGLDIAGEVVEVGQGVAQFKAGHKVVCFLELKVWLTSKLASVL